ncbi:unnamed protein product, partial [marine sediment metagenome]
MQNMFYKDGQIRPRPGFESAAYITTAGTLNYIKGIYNFETVLGNRKDLILVTNSGMTYIMSRLSTPQGTGTLEPAATGNVCAENIMKTLTNRDDLFVTFAEFFDISGTQPQLVYTIAGTEHRPGSRMSPLMILKSGGGTVSAVITCASDFTGGSAGASFYGSTAATFIFSKIVRNNNAHLVIMNTAESTMNYPYRVRWTNRQGRMGDGDWGNARFDLVDTAGAIVNSEMLGNSLIIYKEDAIYSMTYIGTTDVTFRFDMEIPDEGLMAPRLMVQVGNSHFFVGNQNIYRYYGGVNLEAIGGPIWSKFLEDLE